MKRLLISAAGAALLAGPALAEPERIFAWTKMDWAFPTPAAADAFDVAKIATRAPLAGVEADAQGNVYVTTPRWMDAGVPSTLSRVDMVDGEALLTPFPSWEAHDLADPNAIRNALGVYVDSKNRMWVVDMGWVAGEETVPDGAQKLIGIDLATGVEFVRFAIPDEVADRATSFLNDIVVDDVNEKIYITDSGNRGGAPVPAGIIVYDIATNTARRVLDRDPSVQDDPALWLMVDGEPVFDPATRLAVGVNGITLSADRSTLYWSVTTGDAIYSVPTAILLDETATPAAIADAVGDRMRVGGGSDGIATDPSGRLWITNLALNRVEVLAPGETTTDILVEGPDFLWPDSLASDFNGGMLLTVNHLNHAFTGRNDYTGDAVNFAIWRIPADMTPTRDR